MKSYRNFRLELSSYKHGELPASFNVRVLASDDGGQSAKEAVEVKIPSQLDDHHRMLQRRELDLEKMIEFGEELGDLLLPPAVRRKYFLSRAKLKSDEGLRIQICTDEPQLAALPWEYVYVWTPGGADQPHKSAGFLALDREISIVRYQIPTGNERDIEQGPATESVKILALLSDGREAGHQQLDMVREKNNLEQALIGVSGAELEIFTEGKLDKLLDSLTVKKAHVFHFAGHGTIEKEPLAKAFTFREEKNLVLVGEQGGEQLWDDEKVAMALSKRGIRLVVLSACDSGGVGPDDQLSGGVPALVKNGIPAVVGMQFTIRDANAIAFSHQFYLALASGKSIDTAVSEGRQAIFQRPVESERDWGVPVLYLQSDKAVLFPKPITPLLRNLSFLILTLVVLGVWFIWHIWPLWVQATEQWRRNFGIFIGITPALIAFIPFVKQLINKLLVTNREQDSWLERRLRSPYARTFSGIALLLSLVLLQTTSSIYLTLPRSSDPAKISVSIKNGSKEEEWKELVTNKSQNIFGGPDFQLPFFQLKPRELTFKLTTPGWVINEEVSNVKVITEKLSSARFVFWKSIHIELEEKEIKSVLLMPDRYLLGYLPKADGYPSKIYDVTVTVGDQVEVIEDFRMGVIWLGAPMIRLKRELEKVSPADLTNRMEECLLADDGPSTADMAESMTQWKSQTYFLEIELNGDDEIKVEAFRRDRDRKDLEPKPFLRNILKIASADGIYPAKCFGKYFQ